MQPVGKIDVAPWQDIIWTRLVGTSQALCKGDADEVGEQDAAEALGQVDPPGGRAEREEGAARLRSQVWKASGHTMALDLAPHRRNRCTDDFAPRCPMRQDTYCPRNLAVQAAKQRQQQAHLAKVHGVPYEIAQRAARGDLPETEAMRAVSAFTDGRLRQRNLLLFSHDHDASGSLAAAWAIYHLGVGRFVPMSELRFIRRDTPLVQELLTGGSLALDDVADVAKPTAVLIEDILGNVCRHGGKAVLTTKLKSEEFFRLFSPRAADLFAKHGEIVPTTSEQGALL